MTPILVVGYRPRSCQSGFSLLELLVVLVIVSITLGMAALALPKNDQREWTDITHRLIVSLNQGKDETTLFGAPISFHIDERGWRFSAQNLQDESYILGDALAPYFWKHQTKVEGATQFQLDEPVSLKAISFKMIQGSFTATIYRRNDGYFQAE